MDVYQGGGLESLERILRRSAEEKLIICGEMCHFCDSPEFVVPPHFLRLVVSAEHLFQTRFAIDGGERPAAKAFPNFVEFPHGSLVVVELTENLELCDLTPKCQGARNGFFVVGQGHCADLRNYLNVGNKEDVTKKYQLATEQYLKDLGLTELLDAYRKNIK